MQRFRNVVLTVPPAASPAEGRDDQTEPPARAPAALGIWQHPGRTRSDWTPT